MTTYPAWSAGQRITAAMLTAMQPVVVSKPADQPLVSSTTFQDDVDLVVPLAANATYLVEGWIGYSQNVVNGSGDLKAQFTVPAGATLNLTAYGTSGASSLTTYDVTDNPASSPRVLPVNLSTAMSFAPRGTVTTSSTAGNLVFQWAQNTSSATALYVKALSWLKLTRIA